MNTTPAPYTTPNPIETLEILFPHLLEGAYGACYQAAEVLACLFTVDRAIRDCPRKSDPKSASRKAAAESWRELAGAVVHALPRQTIRTDTNPAPFDPFTLDKRVFLNGESLQKIGLTASAVLTLMVPAARAALPHEQKFTDNYHAVICHQLANLGLVSHKSCETFCRDVVSLPVPSMRSHTSLVYPLDFDFSEPMHTDYENWEHDDWEHPAPEKLRDLF